MVNDFKHVECGHIGGRSIENDVLVELVSLGVDPTATKEPSNFFGFDGNLGASNDDGIMVDLGFMHKKFVGVVDQEVAPTNEEAFIVAIRH